MQEATRQLCRFRLSASVAWMLECVPEEVSKTIETLYRSESGRHDEPSSGLENNVSNNDRGGKSTDVKSSCSGFWRFIGRFQRWGRAEPERSARQAWNRDLSVVFSHAEFPLNARARGWIRRRRRR